jgi:hypothetical protein
MDKVEKAVDLAMRRGDYCLGAEEYKERYKDWKDGTTFQEGDTDVDMMKKRSFLKTLKTALTAPDHGQRAGVTSQYNIFSLAKRLYNANAVRQERDDVFTVTHIAIYVMKVMCYCAR